MDDSRVAGGACRRQAPPIWLAPRWQIGLAFQFDHSRVISCFSLEKDGCSAPRSWQRSVAGASIGRLLPLSVLAFALLEFDRVVAEALEDLRPAPPRRGASATKSTAVRTSGVGAVIG